MDDLEAKLNKFGTDALAAVDHFKAQRDALRDALQEIADGCVPRRPGHVDYHRNRTKQEIEDIARAALSASGKPLETA